LAVEVKRGSQVSFVIIKTRQLADWVVKVKVKVKVKVALKQAMKPRKWSRSIAVPFL
jgi:hypothetical protein